MHTPPPHQLATENGDLVLRFYWHADRYVHTFQSHGVTGLASLEGTPDQSWPASPAIQQLSTETIDGKPTILGVGCCGTTHVSLSVQFDHDAQGDPDHAPTLRFDWAARLSKPLSIDDAKTAWLGSTYHTPDSTSDSPLKIINLANTSHSSDNPLAIRPAQITDVRTVQWSYRIELSHSTSPVSRDA